MKQNTLHAVQWFHDYQYVPVNYSERHDQTILFHI